MARMIEISQNNFVLVDDDMYEELNQYKWFTHKGVNTCYARRNENNTMVYMHRQILDLKRGDGKITDHINRNGLDNRRSNLRIVNKTVNNRNRKLCSHNTSGHVGVCWNTVLRKWVAQITVENENIYLGYYDDIEDAIDARRDGETKYWKDNI